jgi:hypothetical protein
MFPIVGGKWSKKNDETKGRTDLTSYSLLYGGLQPYMPQGIQGLVKYKSQCSSNCKAQVV